MPKHRTWARIAVALTAVTTVLGTAVPAATATGRAWHRPPVEHTRSVDGHRARVKPLVVNRAMQAAAARRTPPAAWPAASTVTVKLPSAATARRALAGADAGRGGMVAVPGLPVQVSAAAAATARPHDAVAGPATTQPALRAVTVRMLSRAQTRRAGVTGLLLQVTRADGGRSPVPVDVRVDYSRFRYAAGGDWGERLRLVQLPACALTGGVRRGCAATPIAGVRNDSRRHVVVGRVLAAPAATPPSSGGQVTGPSVSPQTLAVTAGASGSTGSFAATSLSPSATWQVSGNTGAFSWSYPMRTPPGVNGPEPKLSLDYNSAAVDGRVASTNNQPSWVGEGQDLTSGYIERTYVGCADDMSGGNNTTKTGDLCWKSDNAILNLNGHATPLVKDASTGAWTPRDDDGSTVEKLTGASNGAQNGEYWRVTTTDGVQYYFGLTKRYSSDTADTGSVWTVPVFGNQSGEPCHASTFAASYCTQAWRWNLDYVVDPHGNSMTYFYTKESNNYERNLNDGVSSYVRGGYLTRIEYGTRKGSEAGGSAPARVVFTVAERCLPNANQTCAPGNLTSSTASAWPDVPFDQICTSSSSCGTNTAPTFFSRKRLTTITTQILSGGSYSPVDTWALTQQFLDPGDGTSKELWLSAITHTGNVGTDVTLPDVTFQGKQFQNRVDGIDNAPSMTKWRVSSITSESGATVSVNYSGQQCVAGSNMPSTPDSDTMRCFPVYWTPEGQATPTLDWFHKYVVTSIIDDSGTGSEPAKTTTYTYIGNPAWHYNTEAITPDKYRTWDDFRGYSAVNVTTGDTSATKLFSRTFYMRGMDGDHLSNGSTRSVTVTDSLGETIRDSDELSGFVRETITDNGPSGAEVSGTVNDPYVATTATNGSSTAHIVEVGTARTRTDVASGGVRTTKVTTSYDSYDLPKTVDDQGDTATAADDLCTRYTYARNTGTNLVDLVAETEVADKNCSTSPSRPADDVSDVRTYYDGSTTLAAAPTAGDPTRTDTLTGTVAASRWVTTGTSTYDAAGRVTTSTDALNRTTKTAYTPASGGPVTGTTVTDPAGFVTTTTLAPEWGVPTATVDPNNHRTDATYDGLGRLTAVWLPDRSKGGGDSPDTKYAYGVNRSAPSTVATSTLRNDGSYTTAYTLYDGDLRARQTVEPAEGNAGGQLLTDTVYDARGLAVAQNGPYYSSTAYPASAPTAVTLVNDNQMPAQTATTYDGAGRPTVAAFRVNGVEKWRTTTSYGGDRTDVTPPAGGTATTTIVDARGRTTALRQYQAATPTGAYDQTTYTYTPGGQLATVTDPAGNRWTNSYDLQQRKTASTDPDRGTTSTVYDDASQVTSTTDGRGHTLAFDYDLLGRKTAEHNNSSTGPVLASWTYDTLAKGLLTSSTRFSNGNAYTSAVTGYDAMDRPTGTSVTIPSAEGALAGTYTTATTYNVDGGVHTAQEVAAPGLAPETLNYQYDNLGTPITEGGYGAIVAGTTYSPYGEPLQLSAGSYQGKTIFLSYQYETGTRRLLDASIDRENVSSSDADLRYGYDDAGNVTEESDATAGSAVDDQCFTYDYLRRLTNAWSATDSCAGPPSTSVVGGPAPYWQSFSYDVTGNRTAVTDHATGAGGTDTVTTATYPAAGQPRPHAPTSVATTTGGSTVTDGYSYNAGGDTTQLGHHGAPQTLTYDGENRLATDTTSAGAVGYLYDADGNLLIRRDPGSTELLLGDTELTLTASTGAVTSTRYYSFAGQPVGVRTSGGLLWVSLADRNGTTSTAVDDYYSTVRTRRFAPFGAVRAANGSYPGDKGLVGGVSDPATALTNIGAREYDPATGRFLSPDPVVDPTDPQQLNGYAYANNSPVTSADPTGLMFVSDGGTNDVSAAAGGQPGPMGRAKCYGPDCVGGVDLGPQTQNHHTASDGFAETVASFATAPVAAVWSLGCATGLLCNSHSTHLARHMLSDNAQALIQPQKLLSNLFGPLIDSVRHRHYAEAGGMALGDGVAGLLLGPSVELDGARGVLVTNSRAAEDVTATTARLQAHVDKAVSDYDSGVISMSPRQARAAGANPSLEQTYRGQVIDRAVKDAVRNDPELGHLWVSRSGEFGPDFHDIRTNTWWDVTTPGQWGGHVDAYTDPFGSGIGLFTR